MPEKENVHVYVCMSWLQNTLKSKLTYNQPISKKVVAAVCSSSSNSTCYNIIMCLS